MDLNYRTTGSQTGTWKIWTRAGAAKGSFYVHQGYVRFLTELNHTGIKDLHHVLVQLRLPHDPGHSDDFVVCSWDGVCLTNRAALAVV